MSHGVNQRSIKRISRNVGGERVTIRASVYVHRAVAASKILAVRGEGRCNLCRQRSR